MPNNISTVATASLASALMLVLRAGRGTAAPKTRDDCKIDHGVCVKGCTGPYFNLGRPCLDTCDVTFMRCMTNATKKQAKSNNDAKPKKGINGTSSGTWVPNSPKKGINATSSQWVPSSPAKGKGVPSAPGGGTWNPSPSSGAKGPLLRSGGGRR